MSKALKSTKKTKDYLTWKEVGKLTKTTFSAYFEENTFRHAAALAYYTLFSLIPIIYLAIYFFGRFLGNEVVYDVISNFLVKNVGLTDVTEIMTLLSKYDVERRNIVMEIVSISALFFTSSALVISLRDSINSFLNVKIAKVPMKKALVRTLIQRLLSIASIGIFGLIVILVYVAQSVAFSLSSTVLDNGKMIWLFNNGLGHFLSLISNTLIFTLMFKYVHDGVVRWKPAIYGAIVTSVLFYIGQLLIRFYIGNLFFASGAGVAGSMFMLLTWIFYTGQIIFLGAKFVLTYSNMLGYHIPSRYDKKASNIQS